MTYNKVLTEGKKCYKNHNSNKNFRATIIIIFIVVMMKLKGCTRKITSIIRDFCLDKKKN